MTAPDTAGRVAAGPGAHLAVARQADGSWRVSGEDMPDLTSAMVLADLLAAEADAPAGDLTAAAGEAGPATGGTPSAAGPAAAGVAAAQADGAGEQDTLRRTVAQLERALATRVRVEQAIGVLAERHRIRPRQAFDLLRSAARSRGRRVMELASDVVDSAANPLLRIPEELAKPPVARRRGRTPDRLRNS